VAFFSEKYHESDIHIFKKSFFQPLNQRFPNFFEIFEKLLAKLALLY